MIAIRSSSYSGDSDEEVNGISSPFSLELGLFALSSRAAGGSSIFETMAAATAPTLDDRRTKATFDLFMELGCLRDVGDGELQINDVGRLDEEKMMTIVLDGLAAVCEAQRVRVALKQPLELKQDGDALTSEQQAARNKVFLAALNAVAKGLTHDGAPERGELVFPMQRLLCALPDSTKLTDGRGWLPMHWAVVVDEDKGSDVTEADVLRVYESDPMALRKHHNLVAATGSKTQETWGYTPAHMLCGLEMTEKNMSLVRQLSMSDARAFTMKRVDVATVEDSYSALHVACANPRRTEALLRLLVQLDPSQMKSFTRFRSPLGLLCIHSDELDERQFGCLAEADSSVEVVCAAITSCFARHSKLKNRVQTVAKLLETNPAAVPHKDKSGRSVAHFACYYSVAMAAVDCIEILKLVLARHKDALKEAADDGWLPAHVAAEWGTVEVLDFVLGEYPEVAAVVDSVSQNLLHLVAQNGPDEHRAAKVRLLCARYPAMMLQRSASGYTPLHRSCLERHDAMARLLCEAGGREAASTAVVTDAEDDDNEKLALHLLILCRPETLKKQPLSVAADAFRLMLRLYPEAAGIEGGAEDYKKTPYHLAVDNGLPTYYRRLLLRAVPHLDPAELRRLNWAERRTAMFVAFAAVAETPSLLARLRAENKDLVKHVMSFL